MRLRNAFLILLAAAVGTTACDTDTDDIRPDNSYEVPSTYDFTNVSYTGQTNRLDMLEELTVYMKTAHAPGGATLSEQTLLDMYSNSNAPFSTAELNNSGKDLRSKTLATEQANFDAYLSALASASRFTDSTAAPGQSGIITTNDGQKHYLLNENGVELLQIVEKGLMGACFYYQGSAVYLGEGKMNVDNETVTPGEGTAMEHHWDEAFGYLGVPTDFPANTSGIRFWGKYINGRDDLLNISTPLMNGMIVGRAAISNKDLEVRDAQIPLVRENWELGVAGTALHYLNVGLNNLNTDPAVAYHGLSEAIAFIMGLKYGPSDKITSAQVDALLVQLGGSTDPLQANLYNLDETTIESVRDNLANYFPSTVSVKGQL